jgi:thymidylate synthase
MSSLLTEEKQYLNIIEDILKNGIWKDPARAGMPRTKEVFFRTMSFDMSDGSYPLFTTKKMAWRTCLTELTWFLKGDTNIKYLIENGCNIWTDDAYKWYLKLAKNVPSKMSKEEFVEAVKEGRSYAFPINDSTHKFYKAGDLGKVYGAQWRRFGKGFDQVEFVIDSIKNRPNERYHIINAWNGDDFLSDRNNVALPACHVFYQFCVNGDKLDLMMVQRSCDMFLGVPFDIASGSALLMIIAHHTGYKPGMFHWVGNSCHLYENHIEQAETLITRQPLEFPRLRINWQNDVKDYTREDFELIAYRCHDKIYAPLSVGV